MTGGPGFGSERVLELPRPLRRRILAMGAGARSGMGWGVGDRARLLTVDGNLDSPAGRDRLRNAVADLLAELAGRDEMPQRIAVDWHPDFFTTRLGRELGERLGVPVVPVQHHHAHGAAVMAEYGLTESLALTFDGMGLGTDGAIWGAELLHIWRDGPARPDSFWRWEGSGERMEPGRQGQSGRRDGPDGVDGFGRGGKTAQGGFRRLASFAAAPLPGGDAAARHPARQLVARLAQAGRALDAAGCARLGVSPEAAAIWMEQSRTGLNAPRSHAAGRLFDAVAALLGVAPERVACEGEAAIALQALAERAEPAAAQALAVPFDSAERDGMLWIDWSPLFRTIPGVGSPGGAPSDAERAAWAWAFHDAVARAACAMVAHGARLTGLNRVALGGGAFLNRLLRDRLAPMLVQGGWAPIPPRALPPGDAAIPLGQLWAVGLAD